MAMQSYLNIMGHESRGTLWQCSCSFHMGEFPEHCHRFRHASTSYSDDHQASTIYRNETRYLLHLLGWKCVSQIPSSDTQLRTSIDWLCNSGLATSIVRLVEFYYFGWNEKVPDAAWLSTNVIPWCVVEPSVYHMAACFITFRPLFRWFIRDSPLSTTLAKIPQISVMSAASRISAIYMKRQSGHDYSSQTSTVTPGRDDHTSEEERKTSTDDGLKQQDSEQSADPSFAFPPDQRPTSSGYITVQRSFQVRRGVEL